MASCLKTSGSGSRYDDDGGRGMDLSSGSSFRNPFFFFFFFFFMGKMRRDRMSIRYRDS